MRKRRPSVIWSWTKSSDQQAFGRSSAFIGARKPKARLRPLRFLTTHQPRSASAAPLLHSAARLAFRAREVPPATPFNSSRTTSGPRQVVSCKAKARFGVRRMFGKAKTTQAADRLSERMRKAIERETAPPPVSHAWTRQIERAVREAVFRQGALILTDGEKFPVALKNISATGARVEFFTHRELPEFVILIEPTLRIKCRARTVWQRDGVAGLAFARE